jgi:hypothetical protein
MVRVVWVVGVVCVVALMGAILTGPAGPLLHTPCEVPVSLGQNCQMSGTSPTATAKKTTIMGSPSFQ